MLIPEINPRPDQVPGMVQQIYNLTIFARGCVLGF